MITAALTGFATGFSLILAIGAQNAFVLKQGLLRAHVFAVCLICALSDAILITVGVAGFGALAEAVPWLETAMRIGGAAFLFWYGLRSFLAARHPKSLEAAEGAAPGLGAAVATCLALTWLNPHVYLDTVALLGAIAARFEDVARVAFAVGAVIASFTFFFSLGYGARLLRPIFARPKAWTVLDIGIGAVMWAIAISLLIG